MRFCPDSDSPTRGRLALSVALLSVASVLLISTDSISAQGTHDPQFKKSVPCDQLQNGNYVWGCNRMYSVCSHGREHRMNCFDNLVLDPDTNQCELPQKVRICKDPQSFDLYRSKDPFTCKGKADGTYEAAACGGQYYQCHGERQFVQTCPSGLVYSPSALGCDFPGNCKSDLKNAHAEPIQLNGAKGGSSSSGSRPPTSSKAQSGSSGGGKPQPSKTQPQKQSSSPQAPVPKRRSESKKEPGYFNLRRSSNNAGTPFKLVSESAPAPSQVADTFIVQNGQAVPNAPSAAYGAPVLYANSPQSPAPQKPQNQQAAAAATTAAPEPPAPDFECAGKPDGIHLKDSSACVQSFWKCANGFAHEYECPAGLFYDATTGNCDHKQFVAACGGTPATTTVAPPRISAAAQQPPDFDCTGKKDGVYVKQPCSSTYFTCNGGSSWTLNCPSGTVFDTNTALCEFPTQCGKPKPTSPPQEDHGAANFYFDPSSTTTTTTPKPPFDCAGKQDGYYYKKKCTAKFIICSKGHLSQQECPDGLLFDPTLAQCQYASECGRRTTTPAPTTTTTRTVAPTTPKPNFDCTGLEDGYYVNQPCTSTFFTCASGFTIQLSCPPTLVFDPSTKVCEYPNICGLALTTPTPEDESEDEFEQESTTAKSKSNANTNNSPYSNQGAAAPGPARKLSHAAYQQPSQKGAPQLSAAVAPTVPAVQTTTAAPPNFDCSGQTDGFHAKEPCTPTYFSCSTGFAAIELQCPNGLVFDEAALLCDYPNECGKPKTTTTTAATPPLAAAAPSAASGAGGAPISASAVAPGDDQNAFSCKGRANGYFIFQNCQSSFYACHDGVSTKMTCPPGLLLDTTTATCEYAEACGRPKTDPRYVETKVPAAQSSPPQQQQQPPNTAAVQQPDFDCSGKENGDYASGHCQRSYIICVHETPHLSECPSGLVFDELVSQCEYLEQCGQSPSSGEEVEEGEQPQQNAPVQAAAKTPSSQPSPYNAPPSSAAATGNSAPATANAAPVAANSAPAVANSAPVAANSSAPLKSKTYPPGVGAKSSSSAKSSRRSHH